MLKSTVLKVHNLSRDDEIVLDILKPASANFSSVRQKHTVTKSCRNLSKCFAHEMIFNRFFGDLLPRLAGVQRFERVAMGIGYLECLSHPKNVLPFASFHPHHWVSAKAFQSVRNLGTTLDARSAFRQECPSWKACRWQKAWECQPQKHSQPKLIPMKPKCPSCTKTQHEDVFWKKNIVTRRYRQKAVAQVARWDSPSDVHLQACPVFPPFHLPWTRSLQETLWII